MSVHHTCAWYLQRPEEGTGLPGTGATDGFELLHGSWELNLGPLRESQVFITTERLSRPSLPVSSKARIYYFVLHGEVPHPTQSPSFPHSKPVCTHFWCILSLLQTDKRGPSYLKILFFFFSFFLKKKKKMLCSAPKMNITQEYPASTWKCKHMKALRWESRCSMWGNLRATPSAPSPAECCCVSEKACVREQGHQDYPKWYKDVLTIFKAGIPQKEWRCPATVYPRGFTLRRHLFKPIFGLERWLSG